MNEKSSTNTIWLAVLTVGVLAAGASTIYQGTRTENLRRQFVASQQDTAALRAQLGQADSQLQGALTELHEEMAQTQKDTSDSLAKTQSLATKHADLVAGRLAEQQEQAARQLTEELGQVKASASEASTRLDGITTQVGSVKSDVDSARSDISQARTELQRARGDRGQLGGLIATNAREIHALRELGDRNIFEFTIPRDGGLHKIGDIQVTLKKTDPRHNRFTLEILADDKRVEKKDRAINEPVQFYTARGRQPYELVVNEVQKDRVVGYLATPKIPVTTARN